MAPAMMGAKMAVMPLRIAAKPLSIWFWPQKSNEKGITLFSAPMTQHPAQKETVPGMRMRRHKSHAPKTGTAKDTLKKVSVKGPISSKAISAKKNDPPQTLAKAKSMRADNAVKCLV